MGKVEGDPPEGSAPPIGREPKIVRGPSHRRPRPGDDREASGIAIGHVDLS